MPGSCQLVESRTHHPTLSNSTSSTVARWAATMSDPSEPSVSVPSRHGAGHSAASILAEFCTEPEVAAGWLDPAIDIRTDVHVRGVRAGRPGSRGTFG